jgi:N-acetylglucosaminyldiphosphoundecaprenol N-acetyl-beta-D-mannosaminyltransferase
MLQSGRFELGHALIHRDGLEDVAQEVVRLAATARPTMVVTPNADHVVKLERDAALRAAYARADLVLPDGMPLVWAAWLLRTPVKERVTGSDLMPRLCEIAALRGLKVFLLGGAQGVAERAAANLVRRYPHLAIVGTACPPQGFEQNPQQDASLVEAVRRSKADLVFVCLGTPRQEVWTWSHLGQFDGGVFLDVGAAIDFCAGTTRRAPAWMQHAGLEWLFRLAHEPRRLAGRYARDLYFFVLLARQLWRRLRAGARRLYPS